MNFELTYSIRMALETYVPELTKAYIMRDGLKIDELEKPCATVEYYDDAPSLLSAGRTSYSEDYFFQVGIFARTFNERHFLESKVRKILRRPDGVPFYIYDSSSSEFVRTDLRVHLTDGGFTPMANGDASAETANHRGYFDISVELLRNTGELEFTQ